MEYPPLRALRREKTIKERILTFLQKTVKDCGYQGAVVGISGGIDSAVVAALGSEALGKDRVLGILLPERDSDPRTCHESKAVCQYLGIEYIYHPLTRTLRTIGAYRLVPSTWLVPRLIQERYVKNRWQVPARQDTFLDDLRNEGNEELRRGAAYYRVKNRLRMCYLYLEAEKRGWAVMGTTNRTEMKTGLYVRWGDEAADLEPLLHLYKTEVYTLAQMLGLPGWLLKKAPSPDLVPGLTDEFVLNISYRDLDRILQKLEAGEDCGDENPDMVRRVKLILNAAEIRARRPVFLAREGKE